MADALIQAVHGLAGAVQAAADLQHAAAALLHGLVHALASGAELVHAIAKTLDDLPDLAGGFGGVTGQAADLFGHYGEAATVLAGAGGLDRGVEGQQVGLLGNAGDHADDLADFLQLRRQVADHLAQLRLAGADGIDLAEYGLAALLALTQGGRDLAGQARDLGRAGHQLGVQGGGDLLAGTGDQLRGLRQALPAFLVGAGDAGQLRRVGGDTDSGAEAGADALVQAVAETIEAAHPGLLFG